MTIDTAVRTALGVIVAATFAVVDASGQVVVNTGILVLDELSYVGTIPSKTFSIPAGSAIHVTFLAPPEEGGAWPVVIQPKDVQFARIPLTSELESIRVSLAEPAAGSLKYEDGSAILTVTAKLRVARSAPGAGSTRIHEVHLTTETAAGALAADGSPLHGMRLLPGPNYVQLVGGPKATDGSAAETDPIHVVLSGAFDSVPAPTN